MKTYRFTNGVESVLIEAESKSYARKIMCEDNGWTVEEIEVGTTFPCAMVYKGQRDKQWGSVKMGESNATIYQYGCLITAISNLSGWYCEYKNPEWNAKNFKFTKTGLLIWSSVGGNGMKFVNRFYSDNKPHILEILGSEFDSVVVEVPIQGGRHWLAVTGSSNGKLWAHDPWTNTTVDVLGTYGMITGYAQFTKA